MPARASDRSHIGSALFLKLNSLRDEECYPQGEAAGCEHQPVKEESVEICQPVLPSQVQKRPEASPKQQRASHHSRQEPVPDL